MASSALSMGEFRGLSAVARARQDNLRNLFDGTSLTFVKFSKTKMLEKASSYSSKTKKIIDGIRSGRSTASALSQAGEIHSNGMELLKIATNLDSSDLVNALGSDVLHSLISELTPFLGVLTSASHLTLNGLQANKGVLQKKGPVDLLKENLKNQFNQLIKSNSSRLVG